MYHFYIFVILSSSSLLKLYPQVTQMSFGGKNVHGPLITWLPQWPNLKIYGWALFWYLIDDRAQVQVCILGLIDNRVLVESDPDPNTQVYNIFNV